jgi:excisionase family DNA binding protein
MGTGANEPLTVAEVARLLCRSTEQVRRYLREGVLPGRRIGGQWFVDRRDADRFLMRQEGPSEFHQWLAAADPDPLAGAIAIGGSGGSDIASR